MMKSSEQIQLALSKCKRNSCSKECPYHGEAACYVKMLLEAGILIRQLERERDAAVEDLKEMGEARPYCGLCAHEKVGIDEAPCGTCREGYIENNWEWRGVQEVE